MFDFIIVTHIPSFYKVNLYNELNKIRKILVIFIASDTNEIRANDFISLKNVNFEYEILYYGNFQSRNVWKNINKLKKILRTIKYKKLLVSGWDLEEFWYLIFKNRRFKNCLALESTINESKINGLRGIIKKIFLSRISTVFASGKLHNELLNSLNYKGNVIITKGVGIINRHKFDVVQREYKKRFLFIGRLSKEKNIQFLINIFNKLPDYKLSIIGTGPLEKKLISIAESNIIFKGQVENINLKDHFLTNDVFILPSISETWGLVVEEALYFGLPVIISEGCGARDLINEGANGYIIDPYNEKEIINIILKIDEITYKKLLAGIEKKFIDKKDSLQVLAYC